MVFRSRTDNKGEVKQPQQNGSHAPLVITIAVVAVVGIAYYLYYRQQAEYYTGRNLRLLSMLTAQIEGRVTMFADFVGLKANPVDAASSGKTTDELYSAPGLKFGQCSAEEPAELPKPPPGRVQIRREVVEGSRGWKLRLQAYADQKPPTCASVMLDDVVRPIFTRDLGGAFDVLLVARDDGTVLYSIRPPPAASTLLGVKEEWIDETEEAPPVAPIADVKPAVATTSDGGEHPPAAPERPADSRKMQRSMTDRDSGAPVLLTSLKALQKRKAGLFSAEYEAITPASLTTSTGTMTVSLGGADYVLFTQPYTYSRKPASVHGKNSNEWIVCGLVSASRFRYDVSAVSASIILIAIAIVLLALCCWPYLRIALIHPSQPLAITDVVLIIICTIVGVAVITLALLDGFAYRGITQTADEQLQKFSKDVNDDFAGNVRRAMTLLSKAEELTRGDADKALKDDQPVQTLPKKLMGNAAAGGYPYIDSIAWIDDDGKQRVRFGRILSPPKDVSARPYFNLAKQERTWTIPNPPVPYVLEWVRSKATGEVRAILAKKTEEAKAWDSVYHADDTVRPPFSVIALATNLIDISDAIRPPGAEMAIIDENGEVIYHSDTQRIGFENFFTETDRNRALRSAVVARREGRVDVTYWGDDQSMYVRPLTGSPWTLVTFRAKRLTRVLNVEATLLTLSLLLLSSTPYFLVYLAVLLIKPRYRAPRLWPDATRHGDYLRLSVILLALVLLFSLNNYALAPWASFSGIVIIPLLAIVTTYLVLHRTGTPRRFAIGTAAWIIVTAMLAVHMGLADLRVERFSGYVAPLVRTILVLTTLAVAVLTVLLLGGWKRSGRVRDALRRVQLRYGYATLFRACGVLLIIIGVVLPVIGFFTISRHVEVELLVKYTQLRAAASLEQRIDHLVTMNALPPDVPPATKRQVYSDIYRNPLKILFGSDWYLSPRANEERRLPANEPELCPDKDDERNWTIPAWAASWLPSLYEDSIAIRPLFAGEATDKLWRWCQPDASKTASDHERLIKLVRKVHFDTDVASFFWTDTNPRLVAQAIVINSYLPRAALVQSPDWRHLLLLAVIALPLLAIFWYASDFVAKRVLLIDVHEPDWLARKPLSPTLGEHIFLVRRDRDLDSLTKGLAFVDVSFAALDRDDHWSSALETLDSTEAGRNVRVVDFEYGINDGAINAKKLNWLERLLMLSDRTVIVSSAVSPSYVPTTPPPTTDESAAYFDRWTKVLECFVTVTAEELDLRHEEWERRNALRTVSVATAAEPKTWLQKETAYNTFLRRLCNELETEADLRRPLRQSDPDTDRRRLLDEICERAETYFAGLWSSCRQYEKLLLYQLAHNGLANSRNRRTLRRLIARGLVRRNPNLELFSESFRLYVLDAADREDIVKIARENRGASTWDSLRLPFFVIIISFLLLLFATQKDMLTTTTALATALTTGLPVLMKLIGVFTEKRSDAKA
ncbi:MAG TPA: cache domain-containing protein [Thermoanaerobaculia bacterium]|nr:cache domain-containing protein [Thermoanaerobaculia bacterium]